MKRMISNPIKLFPPIILVAITCIALVLIGCSNESTESTTEELTTVVQEWVVGEVSDISDNSLTLETTSDSTGALSGTIRVGTETIEATTMNNIAVGRSIEVHYSGQVGTSEPPFIAADSIDVL